MTPRRIILVREWDAQHSGSGCCGRLDGGGALAGAADFSASRRIMTAMGAVYRALCDRFPATRIEVADPRNSFWLLPAVWRDGHRAGAGWRQCLRQVLRAQVAAAIIVDGEIWYSGTIPDPDTVVARIADAANYCHA